MGSQGYFRRHHVKTQRHNHQPNKAQLIIHPINIWLNMQSALTLVLIVSNSIDY